MRAEEGAPAPQPKKLTVVGIGLAGLKLERLQRRKGKPGPNDWLAHHPEPGQNFKQYIAVNPNRPDRRRTTLYIQPLGEFTEEELRLLDLTEEFMGLFYGMPIKTLEKLPLGMVPDRARRKQPWGDQLSTPYILTEILRPRRAGDAVATLALSASGLWPGEGWHYGFEEASLDDGVGVWSLARYGNPKKNFAWTLRRTLHVAVHETGHMLGMYHCTAYECGW